MDLFQQLGNLALGSRLRRLSDRFLHDAATIYAAQDLAFEPRWFPLFVLLLERDACPTGDAAKALGLSHAAVSQTARDMARAKVLVARKDPDDERRTLLSLTEKGHELSTRLRPLWDDIRAAADEAAAATGVDILAALTRLERVLDEEGIASRTARRVRARTLGEVTIRDYAPELRSAFLNLNLEWIQRIFAVEPEDLKVLGDPEAHVLAHGGHILFAVFNGEPIGCVALLARGAGVFELGKMAVTAKAQGKGAGRKLMEAAIARTRALGAQRIFLETNDTLTPAVSLYRSVGFTADPTQGSVKYARVNLVMRLDLASP